MSEMISPDAIAQTGGRPAKFRPATSESTPARLALIVLAALLSILPARRPRGPG